MKKFSNLNDSIKKDDTIEDKINKLIETLSVEIDGIESPWVKNISIKSSEDFIIGMRNIIRDIYIKEKLSILEKAKNSHYTGDISWISDEIQIIKKNNK